MDAILKPMFSSHVSYHLWATQEMFQSISSVDDASIERNLGTSFGSLHGTLNHMFAADRIWIDRLNGKTDATLQAVATPAGISTLEDEWTDILKATALDVSHFATEDFIASRHFVNSQGTTFTMPVWQILLHMINHGTAHRGQVTGMLRQLGVKPTGTDLVQFYRSHPLGSMSVPAAHGEVRP